MLQTIEVEFGCGHRLRLKATLIREEDEGRICQVMKERLCFGCELNRAQTSLPRPYRKAKQTGMPR